MNKKEREILRNEIQMKNVMTKKIGGWSRKSFGLCIIMAMLTYWGFSGMEDSFLSVPDIVRDIVKWIALILAIVSGIFAILSFMSFRNSKKHVLGLIDKLNSK
ncbi:CHASE3 domain sensor protein [Breznakia sp. PF5-3]|uniref:hypothetical protein n=1 Tax=unclassified Breznakia TaxID=2623764 RepID=UPI002406B76B|nr:MULTISPECIES: hypothetical protein [unclassified Breznakia]MDL2276425.1 hypothetical protein [Breznakia sp. OttesenSCG-928-G09]MDF9823811.1 CHASE3 domain sensor protein [Breznakia sp. PM6-1]MDF9834623.1 CHASE3 domain sensor protein [Breznakia sp. PF5-3]MDF9836760.1 CHASE3 domain sensor protein [Breznakia sp. PFB2-8]MDF9858791.1 CHASE3 domain sensor protein [Breznakia sp. PH5-24]